MSRWTLLLVLRCLGGFLAGASRRADFRAALSRDRSVALETADGVAIHFAFRNRGVRTLRGPASAPDLKLSFATSRDALGMLLARDGLDPMLLGMRDGTISVEGDLMLFVWFQGRIEEALPFASRRKIKDRFPGAYVTARDDIAAARWIRREPAATMLDPEWKTASRQREALLMMQVAAGEQAPKF